MNRLAESSGLAPLRHRDFRLLFFGRVVSFAGSAMAPVALAFAVLGIGGPPTQLGMVLALAILHVRLDRRAASLPRRS